jgi:hypothetical protein
MISARVTWLRGQFLPTWRARWFLFADGRLNYGPVLDDHTGPAGALAPHTLLDVDVDEAREQGLKFLLEGGRTLHVVAGDRRTMLAWLGAIRRHLTVRLQLTIAATVDAAMRAAAVSREPPRATAAAAAGAGGGAAAGDAAAAASTAAIRSVLGVVRGAAAGGPVAPYTGSAPREAPPPAPPLHSDDEVIVAMCASLISLSDAKRARLAPEMAQLLTARLDCVPPLRLFEYWALPAADGGGGGWLTPGRGLVHEISDWATDIAAPWLRRRAALASADVGAVIIDPLVELALAGRRTRSSEGEAPAGLVGAAAAAGGGGADGGAAAAAGATPAAAPANVNLRQACMRLLAALVAATGYALVVVVGVVGAAPVPPSNSAQTHLHAHTYARANLASPASPLSPVAAPCTRCSALRR